MTTRLGAPPEDFGPDPGPSTQQHAPAGVRVRDAAKAEPYRLGLTLLIEMKRRHPEFAWRGDGSGFDRLVGTRSVRTAIDRGDSVDAIVAADAPAVAEFRRLRAPSLLY